MSAMEWLLALAIVVAGWWVVGAVADALIGRTPLTRALHYAQDRAQRAATYARDRAVALRLALLRLDHTRVPRPERARPAYRQES